jgi:hypothetical protein
MDGGFIVYQIIVRVVGTNIILAGFATVKLVNASLTLQVMTRAARWRITF